MQLAKIFTDHLVLQREMPIRVFGTGSGTAVVRFLGEEVTKTFSEEKWCVELSPRPAGGPFEMEIDLNGETVTLSDILIGDVFLACGQSNMEMPLFRTESGFADAAHCENENIRYFTVPRRYKKGLDTYNYHFIDMFSTDTPWAICKEDTAINFSAIGHYFAEIIQKEADVPVGIISCNWGGRRIEAFIEKSYFYGEPSLESQMREFEEYNKTLDMEAYEKEILDFEEDVKQYILTEQAGCMENVLKMGVYAAADTINLDRFPCPPKGPYDSTSPATLWDSMFSEIVPYGARAMLWYQGESNGSDRDYCEKYLTFLRCIREQFKSDMEVYAVELAPYLRHNMDYRMHPNDTFITEDNWAYLREQQQEATVKGKKNYLITTQGLGDMYDIHPKRKKELAERMAKKALRYTYGLDVPADQPVYRSAEFKDGKAYITLDNAEGLFSRLWSVEMKIAGEDKVLHPATVEITEDNRLVVYSENVPEPILVRYGFCMYNFSGQIYNKYGLPLAPFRTDKDA